VNLLRLVPLVLAAVFPNPHLDAAPRTWRDTSGRTLKADFLYADSDQVYLKLARGTTSEIPLGLLSNEDLQFVQQWNNTRKMKGILFEAPLVFEVYRSKKFSAAQAQNAGYFPLGASDSGAILRLEFHRYGKAPKKGVPRPVLRIHTAKPHHAGTTSTIAVYFRNRLVGSVAGATHNSRVDIPLKPSVLTGPPLIELSIKCGRDTVLIQSKHTGKGPRLLIVNPPENPDKP